MKLIWVLESTQNRREGGTTFAETVDLLSVNFFYAHLIEEGQVDVVFKGPG